MDELYEDLNNFERVAEYDELKKDNSHLHKCVKEMEEKISKLTQDNKLLTEKFNNIERNFATLLKTARAEIDRKTEMIAKLNMEKDQLIFRHIGNRNNTLEWRKSRFSQAEKRKLDSPQCVENKVPKLEIYNEVQKTEVDTTIVQEGQKKDFQKSMLLARTAESSRFSSDDEIHESSQNVQELTLKSINADESSSSIKELKSLRSEIKKSLKDNKKKTKEITSPATKRFTNGDNNIDRKVEVDSKVDRRKHRSSSRYENDHRSRKSPKEFDNQYYDKSCRGSFTRTNFRNERRPHYSKSKGNPKYERTDRYKRSQSPDPSISSKSRSRRPSRPFQDDRLRVSPQRTRRKSTENAIRKEDHENIQKRSYKRSHSTNRRRNQIDDSKQILHRECNSQGNNSNEEVNYLEKMEEEYTLHPVQIDELHLDEDTKDHYHNDNLKQQRSNKNEKTYINKIIHNQEIKLDLNESNMRILQSPDSIDIGCSSVSTYCRNIQEIGFLTLLDDPRLYSEKYFDSKYIRQNKLNKLANKNELDKRLIFHIRPRNMDLNLRLPKFATKEMKESKNNSCLKDGLCDEDMKDVCMDFDSNVLNASVESGELNETIYSYSKIENNDKQNVIDANDSVQNVVSQPSEVPGNSPEIQRLIIVRRRRVIIT